MEHQFCVELATIYGIEESILINNIYFWIRKNVANGTNEHDGRVWTYNSSKAFSVLFPYMTESKIYRVIKSLEDKGVILKGNYNDNKYDRTTWYSFTDNAIKQLNDLKYDVYGFSKSILFNKKKDFAKNENGSDENVKCITDSNTNNKQDNKEESTNVDTKKEKTKFDKFNDWMKDNTPNVLKLSSQMTEEQFNKLRAKYDFEQMSYILLQMENYKGLSKKYTSVYLTFNNWAKREYGTK